MLERIKLLLNRTEEDSLDELLQVLISLCKEEAYNYCNFEEYDEVLDYIIIQMVIERYNRIGSEGATNQSSSGVSNEYDSFYSDKVVKMLNKHRRMRTL